MMLAVVSPDPEIGRVGLRRSITSIDGVKKSTWVKVTDTVILQVKILQNNNRKCCQLSYIASFPVVFLILINRCLSLLHASLATLHWNSPLYHLSQILSSIPGSHSRTAFTLHRSWACTTRWALAFVCFSFFLFSLYFLAFSGKSNCPSSPTTVFILCYRRKPRV